MQDSFATNRTSSTITYKSDSRKAHLSSRATAASLLAGLLFTTLPSAVAQSVSWTMRNPLNHPTPREQHAMAYDSARHVTVLFGGRILALTSTAETWEWNGTNWTRRQVPGPSARFGHSMAYDSARGVTVLYGGGTWVGSNFVTYNDTWEWNGTTWTQRMATGPLAGSSHAMAYDSGRGVIVLFSPDNRTWEWNGSGAGAWTQRLGFGPSARATKIAYDSVRRLTVLFGGTPGGGAWYSDTWEWNGTTWSLRANGGPSNERHAHALAFDEARGVTVLFGGFRNNFCYADTQTWNGTSWTTLVISGPTARYNHAMAYDSARGTIVLFGGTNCPDTYRDDTWELSASCAITAHPRSTSVCGGQGAAFGITAIGPGPVTYVWQVESSPNNWVAITETPVALPCGGSVSATPANTANTTVVVVACAGVNTYRLRAVVTIGACNLTSRSATLTLNPADLNGDGVTTSEDFFLFLCNFLNPGKCVPTVNTDFNHDGQVNSQDFFTYLTVFFAGC